MPILGIRIVAVPIRMFLHVDDIAGTTATSDPLVAVSAIRNRSADRWVGFGGLLSGRAFVKGHRTSDGLCRGYR
jgi:hypothetical protein